MPGSLLPLFTNPMELPPGSMVMDFIRGQYRGMNPDLLTVTRTSTGYVQMANGLLVQVEANRPRISDLGLLREESSTNLVFPSEDANSWITGASYATVTADAYKAPNGTTTGDKLVEDTSSGSGHRMVQTLTTLTDNTDYILSCYCRAAERNWVYLRINDKAGGVNRVYFNLSTGAIGTVAGTVPSYGIDIIGNGPWYRCWIQANSSSGGNVALIIGLADADNSPGYTGDGTSGAGFWGMQLEQRTSPKQMSSYIPTTSASVTRSTDAISIPTGHKFSSWFTNANAGIWFAAGTSVDNNSGASARRLLDVTDGTANNRFVLALSISNTARYLVSKGGSAQADILSSATFSRTPFNLAGAYVTNDFQQATNGVLGTQDSSGSLPTPTQVTIGSDIGATSTASWEGYITALGYIPGDYSDDFLKLVRLT